MQEKQIARQEISSKNRVKEFLKAHWWKLALGAVVIGGSIALYKNKDLILSMFTPEVQDIDTIKDVLTDIKGPASTMAAGNTFAEKVIDVSSHIRNLPEGWSASLSKKGEAEALGILLHDGQTLVDSYSKTIRVAA